MTLGKLKKNIFIIKTAANSLLDLTAKQREQVLSQLARLLLSNTKQIIAANHRDVLLARQAGKTQSFVERLELDDIKIKSMADSVKSIAKFKDNLFEIIETRRPASGLLIKKVRYPLGLIAMIYESRPNVTIDAFAMAFKSGNAILLKGGKEIKYTSRILVKLIKKSLTDKKINSNVVSNLNGIDKKMVSELLSNRNIDCLIPRGGKSLINFVTANTRIPVIITGASVVHMYIDDSADLRMARKVVVNAKTRRVSICNALDVLLLHQKVYKKVLVSLFDDLSARNVELMADKRSYQVLKKINYSKLKPASANDFDTEFLACRLAIKVVDNFDQAIDHIRKHSLGHSEAIITQSKKHTQEFFRQIDAACLYLNTSTQFSDGGEFGMGGEIGISTQKLHARGPFAFSELTTYKYLVESKGLTRG